MLNANQARDRLRDYEITQKISPSLAKSGHFANALDAWHRQWQAEKRPLTQEEVVRALWLKIGKNGRTLRVRPLADGTFEECELFFPAEQWQGRWRIEDGVLIFQVGWYVLYVVGSKSGLHSGLEFDEQKDDPQTHAYYQVGAIQST